MKVWELIQMGGPVAYLIIGFGLLALVVFVERSLSLHRARISADTFVNGIVNGLALGNRDGKSEQERVREALVLCDETPGPVSHLTEIAIKSRAQSRDVMEQTLQETASGEISRMERRLVVIASVAQVAPLLGLLGTVLGIWQGAMVLMQEGPLVQSANVMDALLLALTTTAIGLIVAIPCYICFNLLVLKIDRIVLDMERARHHLISFFCGDPVLERGQNE